MTIRVKTRGEVKRIWFDCDDCKTRSRSIPLQEIETPPGKIWWEPSLKLLGGFVVEEDLYVFCVCAGCMRRRLGGPEQTVVARDIRGAPMRTQYTPYIRRRHSRDKTHSIRVAFQMELYGPDCYVLVQRGCARRVLAVRQTKRELIMSITGAMTAALRRGHDWRRPTLSDFRSWAKRVGHQARYAEQEEIPSGEI